MIDIEALKKKKSNLYQKIRDWKIKGKDVSALEKEHEQLSDAIIKAKVELKEAKIKAKQSIKAKIAADREQKRQAKKAAEEEKGNKWAAIGIPDYTHFKKKEYWVYVLWRANRARLDRTKFPFEKDEKVEDSPMFAEHTEAAKACKKCEKKDKQYIYFARPTLVPESSIPTKQLKKIKESTWNKNRPQLKSAKVESDNL